jgi:hypothetical protein
MPIMMVLGWFWQFKEKMFYVDIEVTGVAAWQAGATIFIFLDEGNQA